MVTAALRLSGTSILGTPPMALRHCVMANRKSSLFWVSTQVAKT